MCQSLDKVEARASCVAMDLNSKTNLWQEELDAAHDAANQASAILLNYFGNLSKVEEKFQAGLVSEADKESEDCIKKVIFENFEKDSFLGEETGLSDSSTSGEEKEGNGRKWIVDPLDGTTNYIHQFPIFCISIALEVDGEIVLGLIDVPKLKQRFCAVKGKGTFLNGEKIQVSRRDKTTDLLLATGFSEYVGKLDEQVQTFADILSQVRGLRRAGAAAYDLCMVAQGVFDGFWEENLSPWDTAAGELLVREAGGVVTNYEGKPFSVYDKGIIAANAHAHDVVLNAFKKS